MRGAVVFGLTVFRALAGRRSPKTHLPRRRSTRGDRRGGYEEYAAPHGIDGAEWQPRCAAAALREMLEFRNVRGVIWAARLRYGGFGGREPGGGAASAAHASGSKTLAKAGGVGELPSRRPVPGFQRRGRVYAVQVPAHVRGGCPWARLLLPRRSRSPSLGEGRRDAVGASAWRTGHLQACGPTSPVPTSEDLRVKDVRSFKIVQHFLKLYFTMRGQKASRRLLEETRKRDRPSRHFLTTRRPRRTGWSLFQQLHPSARRPREAALLRCAWRELGSTRGLHFWPRQTMVSPKAVALLPSSAGGSAWDIKPYAQALELRATLKEAEGPCFYDWLMNSRAGGRVRDVVVRGHRLSSTKWQANHGR